MILSHFYICVINKLYVNECSVESFVLSTLQNYIEVHVLLNSRWSLSRTEKPAMGGCIGSPRDGTSHSGESSDVSGTSIFSIIVYHCLLCSVICICRDNVCFCLLPMYHPRWQSTIVFSNVCPCVCLRSCKTEKLLIRFWCKLVVISIVVPLTDD